MDSERAKITAVPVLIALPHPLVENESSPNRFRIIFFFYCLKVSNSEELAEKETSKWEFQETERECVCERVGAKKTKSGRVCDREREINSSNYEEKASL